MGNGSGLLQATHRFVSFAGVWWSVDRTGVGVAVGAFVAAGWADTHPLRASLRCSTPKRPSQANEIVRH
jgi:hypothetical protein